MSKKTRDWNAVSAHFRNSAGPMKTKVDDLYDEWLKSAYRYMADREYRNQKLSEIYNSVEPEVLKVMAVKHGWVYKEDYGTTSQVYGHDNLSEIIIPNTKKIADYAQVVHTLIQAFSEQLSIPAQDVLCSLTILSSIRNTNEQ